MDALLTSGTQNLVEIKRSLIVDSAASSEWQDLPRKHILRPGFLFKGKATQLRSEIMQVRYVRGKMKSPVFCLPHPAHLLKLPLF